MAGHVPMPPDMPVLLLAARAPSSPSSQSPPDSNVDLFPVPSGVALWCPLLFPGETSWSSCLRRGL